MTGFEPMIAGLSALVLNTVTETAKEESGSTLGRWLNKDISKALAQQVHNASGAYLTNYQQRHGTLKVTCVRMDTPMELDKLYTVVRLLERSELRYFESVEGLLAQYRENGRRGFGGEDSEKQDGTAVANQQQFLMVLGGPGIGKSTLLRKVGLEALKRKRGNFSHDCLPVFLPLQQFKDLGISIEQRIVEELDICGFPEPEAVTAALLKKGRLLLLLDGLDEIAKDLEDAVIEQIRNFVDRYSNNRFIVSCRMAAYKGGFPRFKDVAIAPFQDEQIEQFICNWFSAEKDQENDTSSKCWELLKKPEYAATKELAQTPLLLTLVCTVYDKQLDFPKNRSSLYGEALDVVLKEWAAEKRIHNEPIYRDLPLELERELLAELAFDSFVNDQLFFEKREVTQRIKEFLIHNLNGPKHLDSEAVLEAIEVQQGILTQRARDTYSFSHLTFQEYLTAQYIIDNQQVKWLVNNHLPDQRWREVFLLVAGLMRGRSGANDLLLALEKQASLYLSTTNLKALVEWAAIKTTNSTNLSKSIAKRIGAIFLSLALARDLILDYDRELERNGGYINYLGVNLEPDDFSIFQGRSVIIDIDLKLTRSLIQALTLIRTIASDQSFARALDCTLMRDQILALSRNYDHLSHHALALPLSLVQHIASSIQRSEIFESFEYSNLIKRCEQLRQQIENSNISKLSHKEMNDTLFLSWSEALQFDLKTLAYLSIEEQKSLELYLYSYELIILCKEASVRVSPEVWEGIEERMLTLPKDS